MDEVAGRDWYVGEAAPGRWVIDEYCCACQQPLLRWGVEFATQAEAEAWLRDRLAEQGVTAMRTRLN
jgi:hypothetical protein